MYACIENECSRRGIANISGHCARMFLTYAQYRYPQPSGRKAILFRLGIPLSSPTFNKDGQEGMSRSYYERFIQINTVQMTCVLFCKVTNFAFECEAEGQ